MSNALTDTLLAVLRGIRKFTRSVADALDSVVDFAYVRVLGLPFIILGYRQTGKTTLIEWLHRQDFSQLENFDPDPTAAGGEAVPVFSSKVNGQGMRLKPKRDVGGEYSMWETDWVDLLRDAKPRGIIFMIDHNNFYQHKDALNFVLQMIDEEVVATKRLKLFMLVANKSDLWADGTTLDDILENYRNETRRLKSQSERVGYDYVIRATSLKTGEGVAEAMAEFLNAIRPKARLADAA